MLQVARCQVTFSLRHYKESCHFDGDLATAVTHFQSLVDESTVLSAQNGTEDAPAPRAPGPKPKINSNEEMDMEGQRWLMEHPQQAQTAAMCVLFHFVLYFIVCKA